VLDVWEREPAIDLDLMARCDLATPHIAGYSADGKANGTAMGVQAVSRRFGLGLDTWAPADVPPPATPVLDVSGGEATPQQRIAHAVRLTYDLAADDARLRTDPGSFERQRSEHPFRREFHNYAVTSRGLDAAVIARLAGMGFQVC
jgi:erythronate-4-phosphate dehydrogenase